MDLRLDQRLVEGVDARDGGEGPALKLGNEGLDVARVRDEHVVPAGGHVAQAVTHERVHVVQRQRGDHDLLAIDALGGEPGIDLPDVGHEVRVGQHRPAGTARGAPGVLEAGQVGASGWRGLAEVVGIAPGHRRPAGGARHVVHGHPAPVAHHPVDEEAAGKAQEVAHLGDEDVAHAHPLADPGVDPGALAQHHEYRRAAVVELVFQLGRGVHRIHVDHHHAGPPGAEQGHRVLEQVRQHDGDPVPGPHPGQALQPGREAALQYVELPVGEGAAEVAEGRPVAVAGDGLVQDVQHRLGGIQVQDRGHAGRIRAQPGLFHGPRMA